MNLFDPVNLFWLIPLAGGIIVLWMLRLRRQDVTVPSLFLWRALLKDSQANTPFQKLRRHLLLVLQLLAALLLILALAKPFVYGHTLTGRTIVFIIDTSASMSATDVKPSRLEEAKSEANQFIDREMNGSDVATIVEASNKPMTRLHFTSDKGSLKAAIDGLEPTDTVADMPAAFTLAQSLIGPNGGGEVRIYSDGSYGPDADKRVDEFNFGATGVTLIPIGTPNANNIAITAMDGRRDPISGDYQIFVDVEQFGDRKPTDGTLSLYKDGKLIDARALTLAGGRQSETFSGNLIGNGGLFTATLDGVTDDLTADNSSSLVLPPPRTLKVLLVSPGNLFLENGLNLDPDVQLSEVSPADYETIGKSGAGYAMVVFDSYLPDNPLGPGNYLVIDDGNGQTPLQGIVGADDTPTVVDQNRTHPVMRFVDLSGLNLAKSAQEKLASWADSLAEDESGTLIAAGDHDGSRMISVGFALSDSDWPLRVSFPIFLTNAVEWLTAGSGLGPSSPDTPAGDTASITVPGGLSSITVTRPDGQTQIVPTASEGGAVAFEDTDRVGVYRAQAPGYDEKFTVNLLDRDESNLVPEAHATIDHAPVRIAGGSGPHLVRTRNDLWPLAATIALAFLTLEWLVYHRRP